MLKAYLDWMGNVFPYMLISETMRIVVPREIEKRNVHEYHPGRVLVLRLLLHPLSFYTSCNALAPFLTIRTPRPSSRPAQYLPSPASSVFLSWTLKYMGVCACYRILLPSLLIAIFPIYRCISSLPLFSSGEQHSSTCFEPDTYWQSGSL